MRRFAEGQDPGPEAAAQKDRVDQKDTKKGASTGIFSR
jgi:hypothetical protein